MFLRLCVCLSLFCGFLGCGGQTPLQQHQSQQEVSFPLPLAAPTSSATVDASKAGVSKPTPRTSLVFSTIDPLSMPWQASLYQLDLKSHKLSKILTGESGDPAVFYSGGELLFFNRTFASQNYRRLVPAAATFLISKQKQFAEGELGDPAAALYLGNDRLLLAHYTQGRLVLMQQSSGAKLASIEADWALPSGVSLKPKALVPIEHKGKSLILVVHDSLAFKGGRVFANGSQQIFVLQVQGDQIKAVDLEPSTAKVQGLKLTGSFPAVVPFEKRDKVLLVSMCSRLMLSSDAASHSCHSAVEEVDATTLTVTNLWDLKEAGLFMNGPLAPGPDRDSFFANVERRLGPSLYEKQVVKINLKDHTVSTIYTFMPNSGGFWATLFDESSKTLFIGDSNNETIGKFTMISESGARTQLDLAGTPYSAMFL